MIPTRRAVLRTAAVGGSLILGGCGDNRDTGTPTAQRSERSRARRHRIQKHRKGDIVVRVVDADGTPVEGAEVSVSMQQHQFTFGTAVDAQYLVKETTAGDPYRNRLVELFNCGVIEHRNKWKPWENRSQRRLAIAASRWVRQQGLALRGHTVIWQRMDQPVLPSDIVAKLSGDAENHSSYLAKRARNHVTDIVEFYAGKVAEWDVVNEPIHAHRLTDAITSETPSYRSPVLRRWLKRAAVAAPNADLYLNEYNILTGKDASSRDTYERLVSYLLDEDAPLDGVGMQAHHGSPAAVREPGAVLETIDRFAQHGVDVQVTEYDTYGAEWTEQEAASHLRTFLETVYSHPATVGFVMWGFWDGAHWRESAPLFRKDWSPKPAYDVYRSLVFDRWWTDENGITDDTGAVRTTGFLGQYEITATRAGQSAIQRVRVTDAGSPNVVTLRLPQT